MYNMMAIVNTAIWYTGKLFRELTRIFITRRIFFSFFFSSFYWICEMMDASWTFCGNHFTVYVNQTIMLYALNLYSDVCQLFLNKIGEGSWLEKKKCWLNPLKPQTGFDWWLFMPTLHLCIFLITFSIFYDNFHYFCLSYKSSLAYELLMDIKEEFRGGCFVL